MILESLPRLCTQPTLYARSKTRQDETRLTLAAVQHAFDGARLECALLRDHELVAIARHQRYKLHARPGRMAMGGIEEGRDAEELQNNNATTASQGIIDKL